MRLLLAVLTMVCGAGGLAWGAWVFWRRPPALDAAVTLAETGRFDEAEAAVRACLAANPADPAANLLMSQILFRKPDPATSPAERRPSEAARSALEHLRRVRPTNKSMSVTVQLGLARVLDRLSRLDEAETAWLEALKLDPAAPEAGWNLLQIYYVQGRDDEARRLALELYRTEPDPHDRVLLLVELLKPDARPPAPASIEQVYLPIVRSNPDDLRASVTLGLAQIRSGKAGEGIGRLRWVVQTHPDREEAWNGLLTGLDESGQIDVMEEELAKLPTDVSESARLVKHRARVEQGRGRWREAVELYRRARRAEPYNRVIEYRLSRALRHVGGTGEADQIEARVRRRDVAILELRQLYDQVTATDGLGTKPHTELYQRIADVRERMQLKDEARAWHQEVLRDDPVNRTSLAALKRLSDERDSDDS
jgi:Flp pilus assembly protein TadD